MPKKKKGNANNPMVALIVTPAGKVPQVQNKPAPWWTNGPVTVHVKIAAERYATVVGWSAGIDLNRNVTFEARFVDDVVHEWGLQYGTRGWKFHVLQQI